MLTIVNYGSGNIKAIENIYKKMNVPFAVTSDKQCLKQATKLILPGVGAFDSVMQTLNNSGLRDLLDNLVLLKKVPVLGICVGMQVMAKKSEEGSVDGLGWFDAEVKKMNFSPDICLPHMGWNTVKALRTKLFAHMPDEIRFYFLHSYYFFTRTQYIVGETNYYDIFTSSVCREQIFGVQFHPEKSHKCGVQLLKNFLEEI